MVMAFDPDDGPCGVCIDGGDGDMPQFLNDREVRARKSYKCCECGDVIPRGATYERTVGKWNMSDGRFKTYRTCLLCVEIRNALCCDGWTYTLLWEEAEQIFPYLTTGCLEQLTTAAAKAKLLEKWREWKGL